MQIQGVQSLSNIAVKPGAQAPLEQYSDGDVIRAEVTSAQDGALTLKLPNGQQMEASQRTMDFLQPGDVLSLTVSKGEGQAVPKLSLVSVNGQPVTAKATASEYALMEMRVAPTQANLAVAASLGRMGAPIQPETFARMAELTARYPALPVEAALTFAASSLPIDDASVAAFSQWVQSPAQASALSGAVQQLAMQDPQAAALLQAAAQQLLSAGQQAAAQLQQAQPVQQAQPGQLPPGLSPGLSALLEQSGVWGEMQAKLPNLPPEEAQAKILQLMSDLPMNTPAADKGILYTALTALRAQGMQQAAPAAQPVQTAQAPQQAQAPEALAGQAASLPEQAATEAAPAAPLPQEAAALTQAMNSLFAALDNALPGERGQALKEAAASLEVKLQAFTESLRAAGEGGAAAKARPALELGQAIVTQVQMGSELGNLLYMPLPVNINQTQQDAALYVLKRHGSGNRVDDSNVTVAICLDTQHLGAVDTLLKVERNDLSLQFRVDSQEARAFMQPRLAGAAGLAFPPQYRFRGASVVLKDSPITPANAGQVMQKAFGLPTPGGLDISI